MNNRYDYYFYNEFYEEKTGADYSNRDAWIPFFSDVAEKLIERFHPVSVLDAGCSMGYLVEALRDRGVEAYGFDISEYAISMVREDIKPYCFAHSICEPIPDKYPQKYDLVVSIEVLEHLFPEEGVKAVENLCRYSDMVVFSSTPEDKDNSSHYNVRDIEYWAELFARFSFFRDIEQNVTFISPQATSFYRSNSISKVIFDYEINLRLGKAEKEKAIKRIVDTELVKNVCNGKIYFDYGEGFSENNTVAIGTITEKSLFNVSVDTCGKAIERIRFDFCEGYKCLIKNLECINDSGKLNISFHNGLQVENCLFFNTIDPMVVYDLTGDLSTAVTVSGEIHLFRPHELDALSALDAAIKLNQKNKEVIDSQMQQLMDCNTIINELNNRNKTCKEEIVNKNQLLEQLTNKEASLKCALEKSEAEMSNLKNNLLETDLKLKGVSAKLDEGKAELVKYKTAFENMEGSKSWRITSPLRAVSSKIHGLFGKKIVAKTKDSMRTVQPKSTKFIHHIDSISVSDNKVHIRGWLINTSSEKMHLGFVVKSGAFNETVYLSGFDRRSDVARAYGVADENCGFNIKLKIKGICEADLFCVYDTDSDFGQFYIGKVKLDNDTNTEPDVKLISACEMEEIDKLMQEVFLTDANDRDNIDNNQTIDVIVPIYNGYDYFEKLFSGIKKAGMKYRLILVDDCSPDSRVLEFLTKYTTDNHNTMLVHNDRNLGFVQSVNKGMSLSENHVAIVNTDVELPEGWLAYLMSPIIRNEKIASTTPFTNSGTICSFPVFCKDNPIFLNLSVDSINDVFSKICQSDIELPTGVGFCMGMNRNAINSIGIFDEESFGKGYCEENDWCRRAVENGFINVMVNNLFVYHKHGGSFISEEKRLLQDKNMKELLKKHPSYLKEVAEFCEEDPAGSIRRFAELLLLIKNKGISSLVFNHALGGGADSYLHNQYFGEMVAVVSYDPGTTKYILNIEYNNNKYSYCFSNFEFLGNLFSESTIDTIIINELVTYPQINLTLCEILKIKEAHHAKLVMLMHDFYCLCPSLNLINQEGKYCQLPDLSICDRCIKCNKFSVVSDDYSVGEWRAIWEAFLCKCDEVRFFSEDSKKHYLDVYKDHNNLSVIPHRVEYMFPVIKKKREKKTLTIGILGKLTQHKGIDIVIEMLGLIDNGLYDARIVLIGESVKDIQSSSFVETGKYITAEVPYYICKYDIDVFFIPSVWPETFSYTTEEVMAMNMPVAVFNLGAPAERVKNYKKGLVINSIKASDALSAIFDFYYSEINDVKAYKETENVRILFVADYLSFASRYRVEHVIEELLLEGIESDFITADKLVGGMESKYDTIVIYRCKYSEKLNSFVLAARESKVRIVYDVDDYVFDYGDISYLSFLNDSEYVRFKDYADSIFQMMELCDEYTTSTQTLKKAIEAHFPQKKVKVFRNVASMEMKSLSLKARQDINTSQGQDGKIVLGYFSGSGTHNRDFETIEDVLAEIMERYANVYLLVGGVLELGSVFDAYADRIRRFSFLDWELLPGKIAETNINLMPLEDNYFNWCKSENKWTEAALTGVPTIASYNPELELVIEDGRTGVLCRDKGEWREKLERLIEDAEYREKIGKEAFLDATNNHTTQALSYEVCQWYAQTAKRSI